MSTEVVLQNNQHEHFYNLISILTSFYFACDLSVMGAGKTYVISKVFQYFKFKKIFVCCPKSVIQTWKTVKDLYNLNFIENGIISYDKFKRDNDLLDQNHNPTKKLDKLIRKGCLFVFDEFHKTKTTDTITHLAVKSLVLRLKNLINEEGCPSRTIFATGSIFCKTEQVIGFLKLVGIISSDELYTNRLGNFKVGDGFNELYDYANNLNSKLTVESYKNILSEKKTSQISLKILNDVIFRLYVDVIQIYVTSSMDPPSISVKLDCKNGYYKLPDKRIKQLSNAITELSHVLENNSRKKGSRGNIGLITNLLVKIEYYKLEIWVRKALEDLQSDPNCKVVIVLNFIKHMKILAHFLKKYNPVLLYGKISESNRTEIIDNFNQPNNTHRLIIAQLVVCSLGINLHDTNGNFPRKVYVSPNYRGMDTHQVTYRFYRSGTKSVPTVRYVYAKGGKLETSIMDAYSRKSEVFKKTLVKQDEAGILFPGEYPVEIEEEPINYPVIKYSFEDLHKKIDKIDNSDIESILVDNIFAPNVDSKEYLIFSTHFTDLELFLRFGIYQLNPSSIDESVTVDELRDMTRIFNFELLINDFYKQFSTKSDEYITKNTNKYYNNQSTLIKKLYRKYVNKEFIGQELWF